MTHQDLRDVLTAAHRATERLQVTEQLAEARQMPAAAAGAAVASLIEDVGREPRVLEPRASLRELHCAFRRLRIPVVQEEHGDGRPWWLVRIIHERCPIGRVDAVH